MKLSYESAYCLLGMVVVWFCHGAALQVNITLRKDTVYICLCATL